MMMDEQNLTRQFLGDPAHDAEVSVGLVRRAVDLLVAAVVMMATVMAVAVAAAAMAVAVAGYGHVRGLEREIE